jgi:hypothetical protein
MYGPYAITVGQPITFEGNIEDHDTVKLVTHQIMQTIMILSRRSEQRLLARAARRALAPRRTFSPRPVFQAARKGPGLAVRLMARVFSRSSLQRIAQASLLFLMMYARRLGI